LFIPIKREVKSCRCGLAYCEYSTRPTSHFRNSELNINIFKYETVYIGHLSQARL